MAFSSVVSTRPILFPLVSEAASENSSPNLNHYAGCSGQLQSGKPAPSPWGMNTAKGKQAGTKIGTWAQG